MSSGAVLVCSGVFWLFFCRFWLGSGVFWWFLVSSDVVLVCSGRLLVDSGEFWWVQVGSGEFWCSFGVLGFGGLWCVLVQLWCVLVGF